MTQRYSSADAFRRALEQRLKNAARTSNRPLVRERQVLLFERFLVRASAAERVELVVKGGMAVELRTVRARTTKDVDVRAMGAPARFEAALERRARRELEHVHEAHEPARSSAQSWNGLRKLMKPGALVTVLRKARRR